jgi:hypothetical protein
LNSTTTQNTLSPQSQETGRKRFLWFVRINTLSFCCLADSILILYAIKLGAEDFLIGLMSSFIYLTMPLMIFGKRMIQKFGAAQTYGICWFIRKIFAAMMILSPIAIKHINQTAGLVILVIGSFGFFAFRSIGFTANTPLIGEITDKSNRGNYISKIWQQFTIVNLFALILLMGILKLSESTFIFQLIIFAGVLFGILGALFVYGVPETLNPKISAGRSISFALAYTWKNMRSRKLLFSWSAATTANMLLLPFSMVALKNGYNVSDFNALFFALFLFLGGIAASSVNTIFLDRVGPRPMLIIYSLGLMSSAILWILAPQNLVVVYHAIIFLINGMALAGTNTALSHYFLIAIPEKERVGTNIFLLIISGATAGLAGTILGGGLLKLLRIFDLNNLLLYRTFFVIILIVLIPLFFITKRIERIEDCRVKDVLKILISFSELRALFTLNKLERNC